MELEELRTRADRLGMADRDRIRRRLGGAARIGVRSRRESVLASIALDLERSERRRAARAASVPERIRYPSELPITDRRGDVARAIAEHQVVIVAGETGSGKSTQLPKICLDLGRGVDGLIGHTQPRRIAARSVAERVAEELGGEIGGVVGFAMRFTDRVEEGTAVKVMTDGLLLAEIQRDRRLTAYDTIILDEAHERSLNIDFLIGYLKRLMPDRPDLKVIITSATIDTERFSRHFDDAPIIEVSGRTHPVEIRWREPVDADGEALDQPEAICSAIAELVREGPGDILVFCSGEREIRDAVDAIAEMGLRDTEVLPLFARLSAADQHRIFQRHQGRRIVVSTNVAETSLTVPGIRYVVDTGTARIARWSRRTKVQRLPIEPISKASADQRSGRCGRLGPGICIRLWSEEDHESRDAFTEPEIQRTNLASVLLQMASARLGTVEDFPFLDPPDSRAVRDGIALLEELGATEPGTDGSELTKLGRTIARLPVDPRLGRMVVEGHRRGCLAEVLVVVAGLSIIDPRERPTGEEAKADALHTRFDVAGSDLLGLLRLWDHLRRERKSRSSSAFRRMCREEYLNHRRVREWQDVRSQLRAVCADLDMTPNSRPGDIEQVHRSILTGLLSQVGRKEERSHEYRGARGGRFAIAPGSVLFKSNPEWVMAADLTETTRTWARGVVAIDPEWIEEAGAHVVSRSYSEPWWDAERAAAVASETVSLFGIPVVSGRRVQFGRIDPRAARSIFIREALVAGNWDTHHPFAHRNAARFAEVADLEERHRSELLVSDDDLVAWFDARIPDDVTSGGHFDGWWRTVVARDPELLDMPVEEMVVDPDATDPEAFPETWHHGDLELPITYAFEPGSEIDGVIVDVPVAGLDRLDPAVFEWHVPGHRQELVVALIRSLPKRLRKQFQPVEETAAAIIGAPASGGLLDHLRRELSRRSGESIVAEDFDLGRLDPHLRPTFRVVGPDGTQLAVGTDLPALRTELREVGRDVVGSHDVERAGITSWDFGALADRVRLDGVAAVDVFPALVDEYDSVAIRLMATTDEQADAMWSGTRRLLALGVTGASKILQPLLDPQAKSDLGLGPYGGVADWVDDCVDAAVDALLFEAGGPVWDDAAWRRLSRFVADGLAEQLRRVGSASLRVMAALRDLQIAVNGATSPAFEAAVEDIRAQVVRLVYPGFLGAVGPRRIDDIERYLRAMTWRLERLPENPRRDTERMDVVRALEAEHARLMGSIPVTPDLVEIGWMLQELRVMLFAERLGTARSVSPKRIAEALRDAELA